MNEESLRSLLEGLRQGEVSVEQAVERLKRLPYEPVAEYARLDHHRPLRTGAPEVVLAQGKTPEQLVEIFRRLMERNPNVLATRVSAEIYAQVHADLPEATYHTAARLLYVERAPCTPKRTGILALTAGTADIPVAEEAAITAELMGNRVERVYDVGVAGLHRLLDRMEALQRARVLVVVAGMEGALPSVVSGLVSAPIIAVPTSVGYGASFQGLAALLAMLNSCANGVGVVNIDNGFGAGCLAARINRLSGEDADE